MGDVVRATGGVAVNRRAEILQAAAAVFARKGVDGATVRDIAAEADILSGSLYHHFDSKDQMVEEILRAGFEELIRGARAAVENQGTATDALRALLLDGIEFMMGNQLVGTIIRNDSRQLEELPRFAFVSAEKQALRDLVVGVLERGVTAGEFRADIDREITFYLISDALMGAVRYRSIGRRRPEEIATPVADLLVRGLLR